MAAMNKYPYEQRVKTYLEAIHTFGEEYQEEVAVEEMSELIKEICKNWRGKDNRAAIAEEIADVRIMLDQMCILHDCEDLAKRYRSEKLLRLYERVKEAREKNGGSPNDDNS